MKFTLIQAANETGKDRSTIFRAVKKGTLSAEKQGDGSYLIDASELFRVYQPKTKYADAQQCATDVMQHDAQGLFIDALRAQIGLLKDQLVREQEQADYWRKTATMLLSHHQPEKFTAGSNSEPPTHGQLETSQLWRKLFGRK